MAMRTAKYRMKNLYSTKVSPRHQAAVSNSESRYDDLKLIKTRIFIIQRKTTLSPN